MKGRAVTNAVDSATLPRHRWYPIKEGFSPTLISEAFNELNYDSKKVISAIEPFSGSGTTPVEFTRLGVSCAAFEVNPFLAFIGNTKLRQANPAKLFEQRGIILKGLEKPLKSGLEKKSTFCESKGQDKWLFNRSVLRTFTGGWELVKECSPNLRAFYKLALLRAVMDNCNAYPEGKCLRYKRLDDYDCFNSETVIKRFTHYCELIEEDLKSTPFPQPISSITCMDSRTLINYRVKHQFDLCITSPPYLNSFDYSDVYRPELFLAGYVSDNSDLMRIRMQTIRSHIQARWETPVKNNYGELYSKALNEVLSRKEKLWSSKIPQMIQAYFEDMERLIGALTKRAKPGALLKIVVGTSAYVGVIVPVDFIIAEIAEQAGWRLKEIKVVRRLRGSAQLSKHKDDENKTQELRESIVALSFPT